MWSRLRGGDGAADARQTTDEIKKRLSANTAEALETGAFGLPWYVCTNGQGKTECFWGFDHLGQVIHFLGLEREKLGGEKAML